MVRAGDGLVLTTYEQEKAKDHVKFLEESVNQLAQAVEQQRRQIEALIKSKTETRPLSSTAHPELDKQEKQIKGAKKLEELEKPHILASTPAGMAILAKEDIHINANENIALTSGEDVSMAIDERLSVSANDGIQFHALASGIRAFASKGNIQVQSHSGDSEFIAQKDINIISTDSEVIIRANKRIVLESNGSRIEIGKSGIDHITPKKFNVKASEHIFDTGNKIAYPATILPVLKEFSQKYLINDSQGNIIKNTTYLALVDSGVYYSGITDEDGLTKRIYRPEAEEIEIFIGEEAKEKLKELEDKNNGQ